MFSLPERHLQGIRSTKVCKYQHNSLDILLFLLPGAELSLIAESFGLLNDLLLPFLSTLDASCPIFDLHLANASLVV